MNHNSYKRLTKINPKIKPAALFDWDFSKVYIGNMIIEQLRHVITNELNIYSRRINIHTDTHIKLRHIYVYLYIYISSGITRVISFQV